VRKRWIEREADGRTHRVKVGPRPVYALLFGNLAVTATARGLADVRAARHGRMFNPELDRGHPRTDEDRHALRGVRLPRPPWEGPERPERAENGGT